jgi:hypothetical protein
MACQEEDEERKLLWRNPKNYIFKTLLLRNGSMGTILYSGIAS